MAKAIIQLAYRQIIDANSPGRFEQDVFNDTFEEFFMQSQVYNPQNSYPTLAEMTGANPKAYSLHYKVGFAIGLYVQQLGRYMPGVHDMLGKPCVSLQSHRFEIIASDVRNKAAHQVAITFLSADLVLHEVLGNSMLLSESNDILPG